MVLARANEVRFPLLARYQSVCVSKHLHIRSPEAIKGFDKTPSLGVISIYLNLTLSCDHGKQTLIWNNPDLLVCKTVNVSVTVSTDARS